MTETSRVSVACTSTRPTPDTRLNIGRRTKKAKSRRSALGTSPLRIRLSTGKSVGVTRSTCTSVSGGSVLRASLTRACISCSAYCMSVSGLKSTEISVAPRIVFERTRRTPSTVPAASSSGRATISSMDSGARSPECAAPPPRPRRSNTPSPGIRRSGSPGRSRPHSWLALTLDGDLSLIPEAVAAGQDDRIALPHAGKQFDAVGGRETQLYRDRCRACALDPIDVRLALLVAVDGLRRHAQGVRMRFNGNLCAQEHPQAQQALRICNADANQTDIGRGIDSRRNRNDPAGERLAGKGVA